MPLHGHQERIIVRRFHRLDQPVFRVGCDLKSVSQTLDGLVMQAVHPASALKNPREARIGIGERHGMRGLGAAPRLLVLKLGSRVARQVLVKRAAEFHVDHLRPAADAENGQAAVQGAVEQRHLEFVPHPVDVDALVFLLLAVEAWVDVFAPGKEEAVKIVRPHAARVRGRKQIQLVGPRARSGQGLEIGRVGALGLLLFRD